MKIISSFMDDLYIQKGKYHAITFESSYIQSQFRDLLLGYFQRKTQSDNHYLHVINDEMKEIQSKYFYFISFDCNVINLHDEKVSIQIMQNLLSHHLENNPQLIQEYMKFNERVSEFTNRIEVISDNLRIEFQPSEKTIDQFIRSLQINIEYDQGNYVPNYIMREFLIKSMLNMNLGEKDVFLLISFPETDVGSEDYDIFIEKLKQLKVTTLIITTQQDFLTAASEESMFLINNNGNLYDTIKLQQELLAFGLVESVDVPLVTKALAFKDFKKDYFLLEKEKEEFLRSNEY